MATLEGSEDATGLRLAIVVARFNRVITEPLCAGAVLTATTAGADPASIDVVWVPGAFELPLAAQWLAKSGAYDAIAALGCVIRGETPHFEYVCAEAARGIADVSRATGLPVTFGVVTADTMAQARARSGGAVGNKGREAMLAAIEMARLVRVIGNGAVPLPHTGGV